MESPFAAAMLHAAATYLVIFAHDYGRYVVWATIVWFAIWRLFPRSLSGRKIRSDRPETGQMRREFSASTRTAAIFALSGFLLHFGGEAGVMQTYEEASERGWAYFWFSIAALIVLHDAWFYWTHRLMHDPRLFRRFHRTHHESFNPTPFAAYSFDIGEAAINAAFVPLVATFIPVSFAALGIFLTHMIARNVIGHSGYELFPARRNGRPAFDFMTTVTHHDLHHAQAGWNYGLYFTWWDRLMGTEHPLYLEKFAAAVRKPLDGSAVGALGLTGRTSTLVALVAGAAIILAPIGAARAADGAAAALNAATGVWATEGHGAHVELHRCEDNRSHLCGRLVWSWDPAIAAKQGDALLLGDFVWTGESFGDGWLANPEDGRTYRGKIRLTADGALHLKGCALVFCQTQVWRRISDIPGCASAPAVARLP